MQKEKPAQAFATTHWSLVLSAKDVDSPESEQAMASLCETYWYPLYAYVRRSGHSPEDAEDLTQAFFVRFLTKRVLDSVDRRRGRFRSFLLACLKNFLRNEWNKSQTRKHGGAMQCVSLDFQYGEDRYRHEPAHDVTPDRLFERSWAEVLLQRVLDRLQKEYRAAGKDHLFEALLPYLEGDPNLAPYAELADRLGMGMSAVKMTILRVRSRYGQLLREEIAQTVAEPGEVDEEIQDLFTALG